MTSPRFTEFDAVPWDVPEIDECGDSESSLWRALVAITNESWDKVSCNGGDQESLYANVPKGMSYRKACESPELLLRYHGLKKVADDEMQLPLEDFDKLGYCNSDVLLELDHQEYFVAVRNNLLYDVKPWYATDSSLITGIYRYEGMPSHLTQVVFSSSLTTLVDGIPVTPSEHEHQWVTEADLLPRYCSSSLEYLLVKHGLLNIYYPDPNGSFIFKVLTEARLETRLEASLNDRIALRFEEVSLSPKYDRLLYPDEYAEEIEEAKLVEQEYYEVVEDMVFNLHKATNYSCLKQRDTGMYLIDKRVLFNPKTLDVDVLRAGLRLSDSTLRRVGKGFRALVHAIRGNRYGLLRGR